MPVITIQNSKLTAQITTYGAELISLQDRGGKEYLWQGDPAVWQSHAPILFPIVSRLTDGKYQLDGITYEMTNHGFAKYSEFTVEEQSKSRAVLKITDNESTRRQYPFSFVFRVAYTLTENSLRVDFITENHSDRELYYSAGAHEGYAICGDLENYSIVFDEPETVSRYYVNPDNTFCETPLPFLHNERAFRLQEAYFTCGAMLFYDIRSRGLALRDERSGRKIHVDYPGFDTLAVWKKPDASFLCIEPWAGAPDLPWKTVSDFSRKYRIRPLAPGNTEILTHTITV
ncbi:MAG: aldose 1-epimerase family protein [Ruminococcaceae bacterium]|nr:aldose 1-epimerase family protein [Oscillospiraceae bacterium]